MGRPPGPAATADWAGSKPGVNTARRTLPLTLSRRTAPGAVVALHGRPPGRFNHCPASMAAAWGPVLWVEWHVRWVRTERGGCTRRRIPPQAAAARIRAPSAPRGRAEARRPHGGVGIGQGNHLGARVAASESRSICLGRPGVRRRCCRSSPHACPGAGTGSNDEPQAAPPPSPERQPRARRPLNSRPGGGRRPPHAAEPLKRAAPRPKPRAGGRLRWMVGDLFAPPEAGRGRRPSAKGVARTRVRRPP